METDEYFDSLIADEGPGDPECQLPPTFGVDVAAASVWQGQEMGLRDLPPPRSGMSPAASAAPEAPPATPPPRSRTLPLESPAAPASAPKRRRLSSKTPPSMCSYPAAGEPVPPEAKCDEAVPLTSWANCTEAAWYGWSKRTRFLAVYNKFRYCVSEKKFPPAVLRHLPAAVAKVWGARLGSAR